MPKLNDIEILSVLPVKVDFLILSAHFSKHKNLRKKVFDLAKKGYLHLVKRGLYLNLKSQQISVTSIEQIANNLYVPSYVSAEWALQFYHLISDRVISVTSVTTQRKLSLKTPLSHFSYEHIPKSRYAFGYVFDSTSAALIARPEKALLDYVNMRTDDVSWKTKADIEVWLRDDLRCDVPQLLSLVTTQNLEECLFYYHRNSKESRLVKWLIAKKKAL